MNIIHSIALSVIDVIITSLKQTTEARNKMTNQEFKAQLAVLNKTLMSATTREEHSAVDHEINVLVDSYRTPSNDTEGLEANRLALSVAG